MSGHFINSKILTKQHHPVVIFIAKKNLYLALIGFLDVFLPRF